jgi:hypothetical protein
MKVKEKTAVVVKDPKDKPVVGGEFASLTSEWDLLTKALEAGEGGEGEGGKESEEDRAKRVAAEEAAAKKKPAAGEGEGEGVFGKSFGVTLEDGTEVEAFDGTEMMKALYTENQALRGDVLRLTGEGEVLRKALSQSAKAIGQHNDLIKALRVDVTAIGGLGSGRRTKLSIHEKIPAAGAAEADGVTPQEFMTKAMTAFQAGKITGAEVNMADARLRRGNEIDPDVVRRVLEAA